MIQKEVLLYWQKRGVTFKYKYSDDSIIQAPIVRKSHYSRQKNGNRFQVRTKGRFSNPENSLIRKYRPGTNVSG